MPYALKLCIGALAVVSCSAFTAPTPLMRKTPFSAKKSTSLHMSGAANSKEDDLERTIKSIMEHVEKESKRVDVKKVEPAKNKPKQTMSDIIKDDSYDMSKRAADEVMGISSSDDTEYEITTDIEEKEESNTLDIILAKMTSLFPFFVLSSAVLGVKKPDVLLWVNNGQLIPLMLSAV